MRAHECENGRTSTREEERVCMWERESARAYVDVFKYNIVVSYNTSNWKRMNKKVWQPHDLLCPDSYNPKNNFETDHEEAAG